MGQGRCHGTIAVYLGLQVGCAGIEVWRVLPDDYFLARFGWASQALCVNSIVRDRDAAINVGIFSVDGEIGAADTALLINDDPIFLS
jgi:hypothetical protein